MRWALPGIIRVVCGRFPSVIWLVGALCLVVPSAGQSPVEDPRFAEAYRFLERGQVKAARERFETLARETNQRKAYLGLAETAIARRRWREALDHLDEGIASPSDSLETFYLKGIISRELARFRSVLLQRKYWSDATRYLQLVLREDSLYKDALYQLALVRFYRGNYKEALHLATDLVVRKPSLETGQLGLYDMYRQLVYEQGREIEKWTSTIDPTGWNRWSKAEVLRRNNRYAEADVILSELQNDTTLAAHVTAALSRVRLLYARGTPELAEKTFHATVASIRSSRDAAFVFEDIKYVIEPAEMDRFWTLSSTEDRKAFFGQFWAQRDPAPAQPINVRLQEHYQRLDRAEKDFAYFGLRSWFNNPDKLNELDFPDTYALNQQLNDKGLVYVRYGEPDDRIFTVSERAPVNESWRYYGNPTMDFHFILDNNAVGNNWRLTPVLNEREVVESREEWGGVYHQMANARSELDLIHFRNEMASASKEAILRVLSTERFHWQSDDETWTLPTLVTTFRGKNNQTQLELYYQLPINKKGKAGSDTLSYHVGFSLRDTAWNDVAEQNVLMQPGNRDTGGYFVRLVKPDSYHVNVSAFSVSGAIRTARNQSISVPDYETPHLAISDLLPALFIDTTGTTRGLKKGNLSVIPRPLRTFSIGRPVFFYFEIYHLSPGAGNLSTYELEYRLTPRERKKRFLGLFGNKDLSPVLTIKTTRQAEGESLVEYAELDVSRVDPGTYDFTVVVTDRNGNQHMEKSLEITLLDENME